MLFSWRGCASIALVIFKSTESDDDMAWIREVCRTALDCGLLTVTMAALPGGWWHASVAKNTSHKLAIQTYRNKFGKADKNRQHFLVNLDCDNIMGPRFCKTLGELLIALPATGCIQAVSGKDPGTTGRIGLYDETFLRIAGYDEEMGPMGYQDVDLMNRVQYIAGT